MPSPPPWRTTAPTAGAWRAPCSPPSPIFEGAFSLVVMDQGRIIGVRDPHGFRPLAWDGSPSRRLGPRLGDRRPRPGRRQLRARGRAGRDGGHRRHRHPRAFDRSRLAEPRLCLFEFVYFARPDSLLYGQSVQASQAADGAATRRGGAGGSRRGGAGSRIGHPSCTGLRRPQRDPVYRRVGQEPVHRKDLHRALPIAAGPGDQAQVQPDPGHARRESVVVLVDDSIVRGSTTRQLVAMTREAGRCGGPSQDLLASLSLALFLRDGHFRPVATACGRACRWRRSPTSSGATASPTSRSRACWQPPRCAEAGFCTACLSGEYPTRWISKRASSSWSKLPPDGLLPDGRR